jgi:ankyrin repeat protein
MSSLEDFAKAIENGDSNQIESLLTSGSIDVNARLPRTSNPPPLVYAAQCRRAGIVQLLLSAGAHIDGVNDSRQTACFAAAWARSVDVLAVLLAHPRRPNLDIEDDANQTALQISLDLNNLSDNRTSMLLINAGAALDSIAGMECWFASRSTATIQALLNRGVVLNRLRGPMDFTPLHFIASRPAWSADLDAALNLLINVCNIDLEARSFEGQTCTLVAAGCSRPEALRFFINAGADVNAADDCRRTPLHMLSGYKCTVLLLAAGAIVDARDRNGRTPLQLAVRGNWNRMLPAFLAAGADSSGVSQQSMARAKVGDVEAARRDIATTRLDFVRRRAMQICIGLQSLRLDALQMCEILQHACGAVAHLIAFHQWWKIATTVKHFHRE